MDEHQELKRVQNPISYKHRPVSRPRRLNSRIGGLGNKCREFCSEVRLERNHKLKLVSFQLQDLGFWWHHFRQIMKIFGPKNPLHTLHTFKWILDIRLCTGWGKKYTAPIYCSFLKFQSEILLTYLGCAHKSIKPITIRLAEAYSVIKLSVAYYSDTTDFSVLKFPMPENRTTNWLKKKQYCLHFIAKEMWHLNLLEINLFGIPCLGNCPRSIRCSIKT